MCAMPTRYFRGQIPRRTILLHAGNTITIPLNGKCPDLVIISDEEVLFEPEEIRFMLEWHIEANMPLTEVAIRFED